jgi:hypothetical protein
MASRNTPRPGERVKQLEASRQKRKELQRKSFRKRQIVAGRKVFLLKIQLDIPNQRTIHHHERKPGLPIPTTCLRTIVFDDTVLFHEVIGDVDAEDGPARRRADRPRP